MCLRAERPDHTLVTTAFVREAYLRLVDSDLALEDRIHFFAVSAASCDAFLWTMRGNKREKRGGVAVKVPLDEAIVVGPQASGRVLDLDEALQRLAAHDPRKSEIAELLCFRRSYL